MYIKFDSNDRLYSFSYDEMPPDEAYEYSETEYNFNDLAYVAKQDGKIYLDEEAKKKALDKIQKDYEARTLKVELERIKEDIEQETFGLVRDDFTSKKRRAAEIINKLRVLEGKEPRALNTDDKEVI